jgi:hypothetical protein
MVATANWLESNRYSRAVAANLCGGTMINEILYRISERMDNGVTGDIRCDEILCVTSWSS